MKEPPPGAASPVSPSPLVCGSPGGKTADLARPPPQVPDHELLQPIGHGAYGEVWLARSVLGTLRAVKAVHRHDFGDEHPFDREFRGIQKFEPISRSHPGLVNILQIGRNEAEGYFYYVMELADTVAPQASDQSSVFSKRSESLITGNGSLITDYQPRTLRSDLKIRGRLPAGECVELGLALTSALEHLHQQGLVHRDIKPSNIIFVNGQPKLADIGLVTEAGDSRSIVGTEGYLAPEGPGTPQADLFSMGKVLYEISTGQDRRQFPDLPVKLKEWPDASGLRELNEVVLKACAKDVAKRYHSAGEMHADLVHVQAGKSMRWRGNLGRVAERTKRVWPLLAAVVLLLLGVPWLSRQPAPKPPAVPLEKTSVFVLPFRAEGTRGVPQDLCGRITDAFIDSLALIDGVRRSPRKSGWVHQDENMLRNSLAGTNNMRHILTGRISGSGDALNLTLRLHERGKDQPAWTESFSGTTNEVIGLEQRALARMAGILGLEITASEQHKIDQLLRNNLEALDWMRRALAAYRAKAGTQGGCTEVQSLAQKALEFDPAYLEADCLDAVVLRDLALERAPREGSPTVRLRMESILKKDETHAGALDQLTGHMLFFARDWTAVQTLMERELAASSPCDRAWLGAMLYRCHGWFKEARVLQEKSEQPEPSDCMQRCHMAASRWVERRYSEDVQVARRTVALYPGNGWGYLALVHCLLGQGDFESALGAIQKAQEVWPKQEMIALRGYAYARMGQPEKARGVLRDLMEQQRTSPYLQPYFVARVYAALGENAEALDWLEKADADRSEYLLFADLGGLRTDQAWDGLQNEPRYWQLCDRLGLGKTQWPRPKLSGLP